MLVHPNFSSLGQYQYQYFYFHTVLSENKASMFSFSMNFSYLEISFQSDTSVAMKMSYKKYSL